jgi:hypothetical protein
MSTPPKTPIPISGAPGVLTVLQSAGGYVSLAISVAGITIPLVKALISKIEGIGTGSVTITFTDLVAADQAELDAILASSNTDIAAINAELARMGLPQLATSASGPAADPAPGTS